MAVIGSVSMIQTSNASLLGNGLISELPDNAVVSVGYTLGTYEGISRPIVSSNLQFIILLSACK